MDCLKDVVQQSGPVAYGYNFNPLSFDPINDPVAFVDLLTEVFIFILGNNSASGWELGNGFNEGGYSLGKECGVIFRIFGNITTDFFKIRDGSWGPPYLISHLAIRFSTSSWGIPLPSSSSFSPAST